MKLYQDVISQSWHFTAKHSQLWPLGLFAIFVVGNGGEIDRYLRYVNALVKDGSILNPDFWTQLAWFNFAQECINLLAAGDGRMWLFVILLIASLVTVLYMIVVAQGGLIYAAGRDVVTFREAFAQGQRHALQLFILHLATYLVITVCALLFVGLVTNINLQSPGESHNLVVILGVLVLIPIVLGMSFISRYAANYIVINNTHVGKSVQHAWKLLSNNLLVTIEMGIIVMVAALLLNIALLFTTALVVAPYLTTMFAVQPGDMLVQYYNAAFIAAVVYALSTIVFGSIFSTWQWTAWTLLFKRLQTEKHSSKLVRIFAKHS